MKDLEALKEARAGISEAERQEDWKVAGTLTGKALALSERTMQFLEAMELRKNHDALQERGRKREWPRQ